MTARTWQKRRLKRLIEDRNFRAAVRRVRSDLHTGPEARRKTERRLKGRLSDDTPPGQLALLALRLCQAAEDRAPPGLGGTTALLLAVRDNLLDDPDYTELEPATLDHLDTLAAAVWSDYDGDEFELFCSLTYPANVIALVPPYTDGRLDDWRIHFRTGHVYIDVTHASPKDVKDAWPAVNWHRRQLGLTIPRRGAIQGAERKGRIVVDGLNWEQVRERVGEDAMMADAWERRYVAAQTKKHGSAPKVQRRALVNFRKNVRAPLGLKASRSRRFVP